jgi:hypothetical protein
MREVGYVARMGEMRTIFWLKNLTGRDHLDDLDADGRILDWMLRK